MGDDMLWEIANITTVSSVDTGQTLGGHGNNKLSVDLQLAYVFVSIVTALSSITALVGK